KPGCTGAGPCGWSRLSLPPRPAPAILAPAAGRAGAMTPARRIRRRSFQLAGGWPDQVPPLLRRVYAARGVDDPALARPRLASLPPPDSMLGIDRAAALLADAIAAKRRILVVADFDCDGATACAVAVRGLRMLGARNVVHAVPNRAV